MSGEVPTWVRHTKQGVYFMRSPLNIDNPSLARSPRLKYSVVFKPSLGEIDFDFQIQQG